MTKWSEAQKQRAHDYKMLRRQQEHDLKMQLLRWLAADPENKYYLGMALGGATGAIGKYMEEITVKSGIDAGDVGTSYSEVTMSEISGGKWGLFDYLNPEKYKKWAIAAGTATVVAEYAGEDNPVLTDVDLDFSNMANPLAMVGPIMKIGGTSFAGFCASILILKAIFGGDTKLTDLISAIGEVIPG